MPLSGAPPDRLPMPKADDTIFGCCDPSTRIPGPGSVRGNQDRLGTRDRERGQLLDAELGT
jgi:hypothetical protein